MLSDHLSQVPFSPWGGALQSCDSVFQRKHKPRHLHHKREESWTDLWNTRHTHTHAHTHIHTCTHTHTHTHTRRYTDAHTHTYTQRHRAREQERRTKTCTQSHVVLLSLSKMSLSFSPNLPPPFSFSIISAFPPRFLGSPGLGVGEGSTVFIDKAYKYPKYPTELLCLLGDKHFCLHSRTHSVSWCSLSLSLSLSRSLSLFLSLSLSLSLCLSLSLSPVILRLMEQTYFVKEKKNCDLHVWFLKFLYCLW